MAGICFAFLADISIMSLRFFADISCGGHFCTCRTKLALTGRTFLIKLLILASTGHLHVLQKHNFP